MKKSINFGRFIAPLQNEYYERLEEEARLILDCLKTRGQRPTDENIEEQVHTFVYDTGFSTHADGWKVFVASDSYEELFASGEPLAFTSANDLVQQAALAAWKTDLIAAVKETLENE